jgi:hypothetical protein
MKLNAGKFLPAYFESKKEIHGWLCEFLLSEYEIQSTDTLKDGTVLVPRTAPALELL